MLVETIDQLRKCSLSGYLLVLHRSNSRLHLLRPDHDIHRLRTHLVPISFPTVDSGTLEVPYGSLIDSLVGLVESRDTKLYYYDTGDAYNVGLRSLIREVIDHNRDKPAPKPQPVLSRQRTVDWVGHD